MTLFGLLFLCSGYAQSKFYLPFGVKKETVPFQLISNLIVISVEMNGNPVSFILDTGVSVPVVFNFTSTDSTELKHAEKITLKGLGNGEPIEAYLSKENRIRIGEAFNNNQKLYLIYDKEINFSPRLGIPIHGILGYDLFKDFVVEINYQTKMIQLYNPAIYKKRKCKKCVELPISLVKDKPFVHIDIASEDKEPYSANLLLDTGGSDALWLFPNKNIPIPEKSFDDFLGKGLSGDILGKRSRIKYINFGEFGFENATVSFPDSLSIVSLNHLKETRNGSIGGEILRRFKVFFDYKNKTVVFKKNKNFSDPFEYNMSGIELQHNGMQLVKEVDKSNINKAFSSTNSNNGAINIVLEYNYKFSLKPNFEIASLRKNSPAALVGIRRGDVIMKINGKPSYTFSLQQLNSMFYEEEGKKIVLEIERDGFLMEFQFFLRRIL